MRFHSASFRAECIFSSWAIALRSFGRSTARAQQFGDGLRVGKARVGAGMEVDFDGAATRPIDRPLEIAKGHPTGVAQSEDHIGEANASCLQLGRSAVAERAKDRGQQAGSSWFAH